MTYTAIAIDDERFALDDLRLAVNHVPGLELIAVFETADDALAFLHLHGPVDTIFCDLDLERTGNADDLAGIRVAKELKAWCSLFYFFTGHPAYRIQALETTNAGHLLKPVDPEKVEEGLAWLGRLQRQKKELPNQLLIRDVESGEQVWIHMDAICCICTHPIKKNHIEVIRKDGTANGARGTFKAMYQRVKHSGLFIQLSQSAAVVKSEIVSRHDGLVKVTSGHSFAISKPYKEAFNRYLSQLV
ncbi:hypothetical protein [Parapedobacter defluvii]|uniref:LytR/AlgR family response regulator transcription factor n=1 Tax=Parapedobacter defluvii TaxID=2045106 RepID=UPI00333F9AA8